MAGPLSNRDSFRDLARYMPKGFTPARWNALLTSLVFKDDLPYLPLRRVINVMDKKYGAVGDNVHDDTTPISAAIADAGPGDVVFFPCPSVSYRVLGSGTEIFLLSHGVTLMGDGRLTYISVDVSVGATTDVFRVAPATTGHSDTHGYVFRNLAIVPRSGTPGRYAIKLDTTAFEMQLDQPIIEDCHFGTLGAQSIAVANGTWDGMFRGQIRRNFISNGILLNAIGDGWNIEENEIAGANVGIDVDCITGSGGLVIRGNFVTNPVGFIHFGYVNGAEISDNTYQATVTSAPNNCMVDVDGNIAGNLYIYFLGNRFVANNANIDGVRVNAANWTYLEANSITTSGTGVSVKIIGAAQNTNIGLSNAFAVWPTDTSTAQTTSIANQLAQAVLTGSSYVYGLNHRPTLTSTGNHVYSFYSYPKVTLPNTKSFVGYESGLSSLSVAGGGAGNYYGFYAANPPALGAGTLTNAYGVYVENITRGGTNYGLYTAGGIIHLAGLSVYANNAAAVTGGLAVGDLYRTGGDPDTVCVVH